MRKLFALSLVFMFFLLIGCTTDAPWRKASVETYELLGVGFGATQDASIALRTSNAITDVQLAKIKAAWNKARDVYEKAGQTLKLAGQAADAAQRDAKLSEYLALLTDFKKLAQDVYDMIKNWKKVSYLEVEYSIITGGELWVQ